MSRVDNDFPAVRMDAARPYDRIRELYLYEEPALLDAIRRGDRRQATRVINLLLVHIYSAGEERSELLKGLLLELVVMMSRAAVEAGALPSEVLGLRFRHLAELAEIQDDEHLAGWLRGSMLRIFSAVEKRSAPDLPAVVTRALDYLRHNACREVARAEVARHAGISGSGLSALLKERTGRSFTELLREARVQRACELLGSTDWTIAAIASECGFCDQSYFTHVFQRLRKTTPGQYRQNLRQR